MLKKITKKSCKSVNKESKLLELVHITLADLKQTMTKSVKQYYVTFIDDFSR